MIKCLDQSTMKGTDQSQWPKALIKVNDGRMPLITEFEFYSLTMITDFHHSLWCWCWRLPLITVFDQCIWSFKLINTFNHWFNGFHHCLWCLLVISDFDQCLWSSTLINDSDQWLRSLTLIIAFDHRLW